MGACGERLLGVCVCVYVVFTVLHVVWAFSVVVRLVSGNGCVVWWAYEPETCRAKDKSINYCIELAFHGHTTLRFKFIISYYNYLLRCIN